MKKNLIISGLSSFAITVICFVINLVCSNTIHVLPLGFTYPGGDCIEHFGFGVELLELFPLTAEGKPGVYYRVSINFLSLLLYLVVIFIIIFIICLIINKVFKKKKTSK